jgi:predicted ATPase
MKIKFSNLGSIEETELDLRPLTAIIGPNNSNKTYIAYSIYGLLQQTANTVNFLASDQLMSYIEKQNNIFSIEIKNEIVDCFTNNFKQVTEEFYKNELESFFQDSSGKLFSQTSFEIIADSMEIIKAIDELTPENSVLSDGEDSINLNFFRKNNTMFFEVDKEENISKSIVIRKQQIAFLFIILFNRKFFPKPFPLPAERNAFISTYKMLAYRRYKLLKDAQREMFTGISARNERQLEFLKEQGDIRYPQPVEDFLEFLTDIELEQPPKTSASEKSEFHKLADKIEAQIQNRNKTSLKPTNLGGKEIKIQVKKGLEIDLYNASSAIKQLAPLLLYLRFRAKAGDLLVIDEPEMNLHPESQAKLLEVLCILVNLGVKVLLTTHSPYIMAHLNNLVNGNQESPEILKRQSSSLYLKDQRSFLSMEQVSAYEMKDNKLQSLKDPDYGIRWDTLSDVSADIQQKFFEIYEAGQKKASQTNKGKK